MRLHSAKFANSAPCGRSNVLAFAEDDVASGTKPHQPASSTLDDALCRPSQAVDDLPMRNFEVLPFNHDHAVKAGLFMRDLHHDAGDNRQGVKDDIKLIAQADCESLTHILTEDAQSLVKYLRRFNDAGRCQVKSILLADGFDAAWFNNGQRGLPGT